MRSAETVRAEIKELKRLADKRRGKPGFSVNVAQIEGRIAAANAELAGIDNA